MTLVQLCGLHTNVTEQPVNYSYHQQYGHRRSHGNQNQPIVRVLPLGGVPSHDDLVEVVDHGAGDQRVGRDDIQGGEEDDDVREAWRATWCPGFVRGT